MLVPPLDRINLYAVDLHAEVHVNAARQPRRPRHAEALILLDQIAHLHVDAIHVAVDGLQRVPVVHHYAIAVDSEVGGPDHAAVVGYVYRSVGGVGEVEAQVHLMVHLLAVVHVIAGVGEHRLFLAPVQERPVPQNLLFGLEAQVGELLIVMAPHLAVDLEESREHIGAGRERAAGIDLVDQFRNQRVIDGKIAGAELLRKQFEPERRGGFRACQVAREHHGRHIRLQIPGIGEHGEALPGTSRQRETAEGVLADLHPRLAPRTAGCHHGQFHTALIDVVLCVVGTYAGRRQDHLHGRRHGVRMTRQIVGIGLHYDARVAFLQIRRLGFAGVEGHDPRCLVAAPEEAMGGSFHFGQGKTRAALFDVSVEAAHPVRVGDLHRDRSGHAYDLDLRSDGQHRVGGHSEKRDHTYDGENYDGYECFHLVFGFLLFGFYFLTQESIQSMNVLYQSTLFCGFRTQWPSSGKSSNFDGTFCSCRAVNNSSPWLRGTRKSCSPWITRVGVWNSCTKLLGDHLA